MPYTADWFAGNIPHWEWLTASLVGQPIRALEIGSYEGRSARWMIDHLLTHPDSHLDCIDTWEGSMEHTNDERNGIFERFQENLADAIADGRVTMHRGLSQVMLPKIAAREELYDLMYIDGSHTSKDTLSDAVHCFPILREGGLMIFDDFWWTAYRNPLKNPRSGIEAFLRIYDGCYDIVLNSYQIAIRKKSDAWLYDTSDRLSTKSSVNTSPRPRPAIWR